MEDVKQIIMLSPNGKPIVPTGEKMPREGTAKTHTGDKALLDIQQAFCPMVEGLHYCWCSLPLEAHVPSENLEESYGKLITCRTRSQHPLSNESGWGLLPIFFGYIVRYPSFQKIVLKVKDYTNSMGERL
ncbi:hypothetical protein AXG93_2528s2070 [Marchantia polymorpha subsp. ruderalis]|uniref:Uncharacterized protein n=1 Tax=Marchantia polymorpha subsp. ruderalis TaxID=1480154 RepID=A0A176WP60_MARPO|nr:hypothetical protein AXG93_2528s2070 [Marchantia polymorpha subsp. ruderalis]